MQPNDQSLNHAKSAATARGKQPFDYPEFARLYPHNTGNCRPLPLDASAAVQQEYETMYYFDYPEVQTVAEFAQLMDQIDAGATNF